MKRQIRYYVPTFSELVDRLSICILKKIWIPENASEYQKEIDMIKKDINSIMDEQNGKGMIDADILEATMIVMLSNRVIWENESKARQGGNEQDKLLKFTHSINGIRNTAKNIISNGFFERKDLKIDCLAANIPKELGNWNNVFNIDKEIDKSENNLESNSKINNINQTPHLEFENNKYIKYIFKNKKKK